jgi:hypothetical protein
LFTVRRADIEGFARDLEAKGRARATVTRRRAPSPGSPWRKNSWLIPSPHVRRRRVDYESHAVVLDRNELGAYVAGAAR